ncbi:MAG: 30S ribosomal protein S6 [Patescibacteria group bacterium]
MDKETVLYEIGYLLRTNLKEEEVLSFHENLRNFITENKGLIITEGESKKQIELAYPIKKEAFALFNWIKFSLNSSGIKKAKDYLDKQPSVLRFLIVKSEKEEPAKITTLKDMSVTGKISLKPKTKTEKTETPDKDEAETEENVKIKEKEIDKKIEELLGE